MSMDRERIIWLDYARTIAIICVVITHTVQRIYDLSAESLLQSSVSSRIFALSMFSIGRLGVPIFFFLTGYLLLDREYVDNKYISFIKRNFGGLLLTTSIWILIYNIFNSYFYKEAIKCSVLLKNLVYLKSTAMSHMWYMPVILGIYLFIPFVANALRYTDLRNLYIPMTIAFVYMFVTPIINVFLTAKGIEPVSVLPDFNFAGGKYGFCILLGYFIKKVDIRKVPSIQIVLLGTVAYLFTVYTQCYAAVHKINYTVWYDSASLILTDLCIFILLSRIHFYYNKVVASISVNAFGIYLIHNPINLVLVRIINQRSRVISMMIIVITNFLVSWICVNFLTKNRRLAKILFFQK